MSLTLLAANNAQTVISTGISASATSVSLATGTGDLFPSPTLGTNYFKLTFIDAATEQLNEIVHVSARSGDVLTIIRGQEGTIPRAWSVNDIAANMMTAGSFSLLAQLDTQEFLDATTGRLINVQKFTDNGTYTPTPGTKKIIAKVIGGGGGGGGAPAGSSTSNSVGGGGGAGAYVEALITNLLASYAISIGNGGPGGITGQGGTGGVTSFGTIISCPGGAGGFTGIASNAGNAAGGGYGGDQPTVSVGTILSMGGGFGAPGYMNNGQGGNGGNGANTQLGNGGWGNTNGPGSDGRGYGSGGGGALTTITNTTTRQGGAGAKGVVIIYEYA